MQDLTTDGYGCPCLNTTTVPARDLFGRLVSDPEAAALQGTYQLCGYFHVQPQQVN
jgi:hypothetical protein